jgi:hypothetical protein
MDDQRPPRGGDNIVVLIAEFWLMSSRGSGESAVGAYSHSYPDENERTNT